MFDGFLFKTVRVALVPHAFCSIIIRGSFASATLILSAFNESSGGGCSGAGTKLTWQLSNDMSNALDLSTKISC